MKKKLSKCWFFVVAILIVALTVVSFFGVKNYYGDKEIVYFKSAGDIRWGIDIQGGVEAVFAPTDKNTDKITESQLESAKKIIDTRLINKVSPITKLLSTLPISRSSSASLGKQVKKALMQQLLSKSLAKPLCLNSAAAVHTIKTRLCLRASTLPLPLPRLWKAHPTFC